jgi:hypothetical protein
MVLSPVLSSACEYPYLQAGSNPAGRIELRAESGSGRIPPMRRLPALLIAVLVALVAAPAATSTIEDEEALAAKFAPVVRLVEQAEECGPGESFEPTDVDVLFGEPTVALRGPWNPTDLVKIGPAATDLENRYEYHLDFPGDALDPGCSYERWARRLTAESSPTVYAHVATEPERPDRIALQYWFFYPYNEFNNLHEGDWEMVQLVFEASDAVEAVAEDPVSVGYSSHEGAERADWGDDKLEIVDGSHPVVYPAAGSHANKFTEALYLGSSAEAGVGCDDTRGPHTELRPAVQTIPSDPAAARGAFPWIDFEGRWGELQPAFFNGPTGPNLKRQWTEPISWSEGWRERSYAVPVGGLFGTSATDFFCVAVERGSEALVSLLRSPGATVLVLAGLVAVLVFAATRTRWSPSAPLRAGRRRTWGQIVSSSARMYVRRARLFLGIGLVLVLLGLVISLVQALLLGGFGLLGLDVTGESAGATVILVVGLGILLALTGFAFVDSATARALVELDAGREIGVAGSYRLALERMRPLLAGLGIAVAIWVLLTATAVLTPIAIWLAVRWLLLAQTVQVEGTTGVSSLRRSAALVHGRWLRVGSLVGLSAALALLAGPFLGALLILLTDAPLALLNVVAGVVYALAMPFVALVASYVYFDARARQKLEQQERVDELPAEIELAT